MRHSTALLLAAYLALRAVLLVRPGYDDDLKAYRRWAVAAAEHGIAGVYRESDMDYPPLYAYLLGPLGALHLAQSGADAARKGLLPLEDWRPLAKLPPLVFDLLTALLLFRAVRASEGAGSAWPGAVAAAYLTNPGVLMDTAVWGHPDSLVGCLVLGAFLVLERAGPAPAFALLTLATLTKPLAAPFFPLLALAAVVRRSPAAGPRRALLLAAGRELLLGGAAGLGVAALVFLPFLLDGSLAAALARVAGDLGAMPYTSVNAHNLWFALGPWRDAEAPLLGPLTPTALGLLAFGAVYAMVLRRAWSAARAAGTGVPRDLLLALAALVTVAFFMLATHMHENHMFLALPLVAPLLARGRALRVVFVALSLGVFANLALHDPVLPGLAPFAWGGDTGVPRPSHGRTFFGVELALVRFATAVNLATFAAFAAFVLGPGSRQLAPPRAGRDHDDGSR